MKLRNDLQKINTWLKDHDLEPIKNVRTFGLYLAENTKKSIPIVIKELNTQHYYFSKSERKALLAISLIMSIEALLLKDLMAKIKVSRGTTINELNRLKEEMATFRLLIQFDRSNGYLIMGSESNKRKALMHYLSLILSKDGWELLLSNIPLLVNLELYKTYSGLEKPTLAFIKEYLPTINQIVINSVRDPGIQIIDEMLHHLVLRLLIFSKRLLRGNGIVIDQAEKEVLRAAPEYQAAKHISSELEKVFSVSFPEDEVCYLAMNLLGIMVHHGNKDIVHDEVIVQLNRIIDRMVADFQRYACVFFQEQIKLRRNLLKHLKPTYYRLKYDLEIKNPVIETLKQTYSEVFTLTKKVIYHLEALVDKR